MILHHLFEFLPRQRTQDGRYFEILVEETVPGWVGGLGIGVVQNPPCSLLQCAMRRLPDKAWRIPKTSVVGHWAMGVTNPKSFRKNRKT